MKFESFAGNQPKKSYYDILGISPGASPEEIRSAFRNLAKKTHPDTVGDDSQVENFNEINEAHEILGDKDKRRVYDLARSNSKSGAENYDGESESDSFRNKFMTRDINDLLEFITYLAEEEPEKMMTLRSRLVDNLRLEKDGEIIQKYRILIAALDNKLDKNKDSRKDILHGEFYNTLDSKEKKIYNEMIKDRTIKTLLEILAIQKPKEFEKTVRDYFVVAYQSQKNLEKAERDLEEISKRQKELKRRQEELRKKGSSHESAHKNNSGGSFRNSSSSGLSDSLSNSNFSSFMKGGQRLGVREVRNLAGNLGVESSLGYERLVDQSTGRSIGYGNYKKIEYQNGVIIGTDLMGHKSLINKEGGSSSDHFENIIFRDGLIIGKSSFGGESLIDRKTGKKIGYSYERIDKVGDKIFGITGFGTRTEIKL